MQQEENAPSPQSPLPDPQGRRRRWLPRILYGLTLVGAVLLLGHSCGILPTSRIAPRSFVLPRDYADMKRIFHADELPPSFKIAAIRHTGPGFTDSNPIWFKVTLSAEDLPLLTGSIERARINYFEAPRRVSSLVNEFDSNWRDQLADLEFQYQYNEPALDRSLIPDAYMTTVPLYARGNMYERQSYIVVDQRSTPSITLYVLTTVPFEAPSTAPQPQSGNSH